MGPVWISSGHRVYFYDSGGHAGRLSSRCAGMETVGILQRPPLVPAGMGNAWDSIEVPKRLTNSVGFGCHRPMRVIDLTWSSMSRLEF